MKNVKLFFFIRSIYIHMSLVQSAGLINSQNAHFSNPGFSSKVGAVSGCGGSGSELSLQQKGLYQVVKTGGKRKRHSRKGKMFKGGNSYGFSQNQSIASTSGVNEGGSVHLAEFSKQDNNGINSDTNMNASKQSNQSGGSGGDSTGYSYGTGGYPYYSYKPSQGENLSVFAGSGYPPISRGLNSQCGGKKRRSSKRSYRKKSSHKKRIHTRKQKAGKKRNPTRKQKAGKRKRTSSRRQRGGYSQYMSNVANTPSYSTGAPPSLSANESALASPPPFTPKNECLNSWKHLGDTPPYNKIIS